MRLTALRLALVVLLGVVSAASADFAAARGRAVRTTGSDVITSVEDGGSYVVDESGNTVYEGTSSVGAEEVDPGLARRGYANYYAPGQVPAQLYVAPRPVPARVGHTIIPYQPLAPHEFLYRHRRVYYRTHEDGNMTKTTVHWGWKPWNQQWGPGPKVPSNPFRGWWHHELFHLGTWGVW